MKKMLLIFLGGIMTLTSLPAVCEPNADHVRFDDVEWFSEGLATVSVFDPVRSEQDDVDRYLWGYIDTAGNIVIPCEYVYAERFSEGLAQVWTKDGSGFIDRHGEMVFSGPWLVDYTENGFTDGVAMVCDEDWLHGFIDREGNTVIPCEWEYLTYFSDGMALCGQNGLYGFIRRDGEPVVPCWYEDADIFHEGRAMVSRDGKYGFIDTTGVEVIPVTWDLAGSFSEGLAPVMKDGQISYIDTDGEIVFTLPWRADIGSLYYRSFSDGMALVYDSDSRKYGYVDHAGALAIPCEWDEARPFSMGRAFVRKNETESGDPGSGMFFSFDGNYDDPFQMIDTAGRIIPCNFVVSSIGFNDLYISCRIPSESGYGFMDRDGNLVIPCEYDRCSSYSEGYFTLMKDGNLIIMDEEGNLLYRQDHSIEDHPKG